METLPVVLEAGKARGWEGRGRRGVPRQTFPLRLNHSGARCDSSLKSAHPLKEAAGAVGPRSWPGGCASLTAIRWKDALRLVGHLQAGRRSC